MDYQNIKVYEPVGFFRAVARDVLRGRWAIMLLAAFLYLLLTDLPPVIFTELFGVPLDFNQLYESLGEAADPIVKEIWSDPIYSGYKYPSALSGIYSILVSGPLSLGFSIFCIFIVRRAEAGVSLIFSGFTNFLKALGVTVIVALLCLACFLIPIIPAVLIGMGGGESFWMALLVFYLLMHVAIVFMIIISLRYSMVYFILADQPGIGTIECLKKSATMMRGNNGKLFILFLSFIGWYLLSVLGSFICGGIIGAIGSVFSIGVYTGGSQVIYTVIGALMMTPVTGYVYTAWTAFYEKVAGHAVGMPNFNLNENQRPTTPDNQNSYFNFDNNENSMLDNNKDGYNR